MCIVQFYPQKKDENFHIFALKLYLIDIFESFLIRYNYVCVAAIVIIYINATS